MKKTIHDTPVENTQTTNKVDDRINASKSSRRKAVSYTHLTLPTKA